MQRPSLDELRMAFGFFCVLVLAILAGVIALGTVRSETSYGLLPIISALGVLAGGFAQWSFGATKATKDVVEIEARIARIEKLMEALLEKQAA